MDLLLTVFILTQYTRLIFKNDEIAGKTGERVKVTYDKHPNSKRSENNIQ